MTGTANRTEALIEPIHKALETAPHNERKTL
jgi:hypothetical protein